MKIRFVLAAVVAFAALAGWALEAGLGQTPPPDKAKIYAEIEGTYEFEYQGAPLQMSFWTRDGKLWGAPVGQEDQYAEIVPADWSALKFTAVDPNNRSYEMMFLRNEEKQIDKLKLVSEGIDLVGVRVKK